MDKDTAQALAAMAGAIKQLAEASHRQADALEAVVARSDSIERQLRVQTRAGQQLRDRILRDGVESALQPRRPARQPDPAA